MISNSDWQHPFVDVFKKYQIFNSPKSYKGSVSIVHDPIIARKCLKLTGSILSNNTVIIPDPTTQVKSCNLTGKYVHQLLSQIYIELMAAPQKYFCIHFEIGVKDREPGVRFTFTNMEKQYNVVGGNTLKIPFMSDGRNLWTIACIDIEYHLQNYGLFSKGVITNYNGIHTVRGIQICSNLMIRGIYTSCNVYDWDSLPKQMSFKMVKGGRWSDVYSFIYQPQFIDPTQVRKKLKEKQQQSQSDFINNIVERQEQATGKRHKIQNISSMIESDNSKVVGVLPSESLIQLQTAFSYSSLYNPDLLFQNGYVYYSAGSILVGKSVETGEQLFLQGHIDYIIAMDSHQQWMVSVQQGVNSSVRIWINHKCICSFQCPYEKVQQVRLNFKKHLAMVGLDPYKRQAILIFDISKIQTTRKPILLAKQISDFNILTIKFSPVEADRLVSCGKQNIRFWRIKNQHLPGSPVILNHHARNTIFTVLDYEYHYDDPNPLKQKSQIRRVYVGSQNGLLFQINYQTHELQQVYRLHDNAAITSVLVNDGFCITGSQDQLLRVWPMNFSQYILQASNDGVVTSLVINEDNSQVACGTSTGTLSILDLSNNNYKTIVRSHTENVIQIVYHSYSKSIITLSNDLTIRLWNPEQMEQTYQFTYPSTDLCLCLAPNPSALSFTAGFQSGVLRIFDIENTCVSEEVKHHQNQIVFLQYSNDGKFLVVLEKQLIMLYSPLHSHQPIKHLPVEITAKYKSASFAQSSDYLAVIGDSTTHVNIWEMRSLQMVGKIFVSKVVQKIKYFGEHIWMIFEDTSIRRYNTTKMTIQVQMQALHRQSLNDIDFNIENHLLFTVGDDSFVKVWDYSFMRQPHQVFIGHTNKINAVIYIDGKLWTAGSEGILIWKFKPSADKFIPPPVFHKEKKATFIKNSYLRSDSKEYSSTIKEPTQMQSIREQQKEQQKIKFSAVMRKNAEHQDIEKFVPRSIPMNFVSKVTSYRKSRKRQGKPRLSVMLPIQNRQNKLPLKQFYQAQIVPGQLEYSRKIECIKQYHSGYKMQYLMGLQAEAHDHVVWNFMYGWYAYIYDNLIIVQSLNKNRSQKIITLPEKLSSLTLTKDFKRMVVSSQFNPNKRQKKQVSMDESAQMSDSSGGQAENAKCACIYVLGMDLAIEKKLQFHPKGIQSIRLSTNNKYLVSIGNFLQCTVCVWDFQLGKLITSSYTLDKLNDIAILNNAGEGRILQFATVGRDQIHFWALTRDQKLQYYDVFIKLQHYEQESNELIQLTACDYLQYNQNYYLICGTHQGEVLIVQYGSFQTIWRKQIASAEIVNIKSYSKYTVLAVADGNLYFWDHNANMLQNQPTPLFNKMNLYYSVTGIYFDQQGKEGVVITSEAIYYCNLADQFHSLLTGSTPSPVIMARIITPQFMLTSHENARLKLWNIQTAQELKTYKWKYACTEAYFDDSLGKVVCFCRNSSLKLLNLKKFTRQETYLPEELGKSNDKTDDYVLYTASITFAGKNSRWIFFRKGSVFSLSIALQGRKKVIKAEKVLEFGYIVNQVFVNPQKKLIIVNSSEGKVLSYYVDMLSNTLSLLLSDEATIRQFSIQRRNQAPSMHEECCEQEHRIHLAISKVLNETYMAINQQSRYVYFRNYMKRLTFQKISLGAFPRSIILQESNKESLMLIGLEQGGMMRINSIETDQRARYETVVNRPIIKIHLIKNKAQWLLVGYPTAMCMISTQ